MKNYRFRVVEWESALDGRTLYTPQYKSYSWGLFSPFQGWEEVLKSDWDTKDHYGNLYKECRSMKGALAAIEDFKNRGFKNPKPRSKVTYVE